MAIGTMSSYTGTMCVNRHEVPSWGIRTFRVEGASELKPGMICTNTGGTTGADIAKPDDDDDVTLGVVLERSELALDDFFADNTEVEVALVGSGAICWVFVDDDEGAAVQNTPVYSTGVDADGFVELRPAVTAPAGDTYATAGMQTALDILKQMERRKVGHLYEAMADQGSTDTPNKVVLI